MNTHLTPWHFLLAIVMFLAGWIVAEVEFCSTDVNHDESVNVLDVQMVVNDYLGE